GEMPMARDARTSGCSERRELDVEVAVIGAGSVGSTLVRGWRQAGHTVVIGARRPDDAGAASLAQDAGATVDTPAGAIDAADVVVCTIPGSAMRTFIDEHAAALAGKIVVDATNDLAGGPASAELSSLGYLVATVPTANGFRAFNSVGWETMADPRFGAETADLRFAGPDGD